MKNEKIFIRKDKIKNTILDKDKKFSKLLNYFILKESKDKVYFPKHSTIFYLFYELGIERKEISKLTKISFKYYSTLREFFLEKQILKEKERKNFIDILKNFIFEFDKELDFKFKDENSYDYQKFITRFLFSVNDWACFLEQGLGKTKIIIDLIDNLLKVSPQKILYITPAFLTYTTYLEFQKWIEKENLNYLKVISSDLPSKEKERILRDFFEKKEKEILIVSYDYIRYFLKDVLKLPSFFKEFEKVFQFNFDILICDESHKLKNPNSLVHKYIRNLSNFCKRTYLLTGTPILNKIEDIFYQYRIRHYNFFNKNILEEEPILEGQTFNFFDKKITFVPSYEKEKEKSINEILNVSAFVLKKESIFKLPEKEFIKVYVKMPKSISEKYEKIYFDLLDDIEKYFEGKLKITSVFSKITKLHELCQGFLYTKDKKLTLSDFKTEKLLEIIKYLEENKEKKEKRAIIFFKYDKDREILEEILKKNKINFKILTNISSKKLKDILKNLEKENIQVLLIQIHKGSHGLNLQDFSSNVIYYSYDFSFGDFSQSQDRIHRIGQDKTCRYFILLSHHPEIESMDEIIYKRLLKKKNLSQKALLKELKEKLSKEREKTWKKRGKKPQNS